MGARAVFKDLVLLTALFAVITAIFVGGPSISESKVTTPVGCTNGEYDISKPGETPEGFQDSVLDTSPEERYNPPSDKRFITNIADRGCTSDQFAYSQGCECAYITYLRSPWVLTFHISAVLLVVGSWFLISWSVRKTVIVGISFALYASILWILLSGSTTVVLYQMESTAAFGGICTLVGLIDGLNWRQQVKRRQQLQEKIESHQSELSQAETHLTEDNLDNAQSILKDLQSNIDDSIDKAREHDVSELLDKLDEIEQQRQRHLEELLTTRINNLLSEADDTHPQTREERFQTLLSSLSKMDTDDNRERELLRKEAMRGLIQARMDQGERQFAQAETAYLDDNYDTAQDRFDQVQEFFEGLRDLAINNDITDFRDEIDEWIQACSVNADAAGRASLGVGTTPSITRADEIGEPAQQGETTVEYDPSQAQAPTQTPARNVSDQLQAELPAHEVLEHLGSGGNADVHKVRLTDSGEIAALKVPQWQGTLSKSVVEDFLEEAHTWDRLDDHQHIINIQDYGGTPYPWMLLEFMNQGTLTERMERLTPKEGLGALVAVCNATHHAHQHGVAHTDLKPENIMYTSTGRRETVRVGDWGLAQVMLEHSKSIEGMTPYYAAPEQIDPEAYGGTGPATDVYQISVIAYEMLTGSPPFNYDSRAAVMNAIISTEVTPPSERNSTLPSLTDEILGQALAKEKTNRYESVLYLRDDLKELLNIL